MISCTEFIPAYSELFTYLENKNGREEVNRFWDYLFAPTGDGIPLINFLKKEGIHGCWTYWSGTLNEEAADFTMYCNEKAGWHYCEMHYCPSKGRLLKLKEEIGIEPYHDYCLHCDYYRAAVEKIGLKYIYNFNGIDKASCSTLIYDPKVFDGRVIVDENTLIMARKAADNEYFHMDFHSSLNMGIHYVGKNYGREGVREYLEMFTRDVYCKVLEAAKTEGLRAIADKIRDTYKKEHAEELLTLEETEDAVIVKVASCPAVKHLQETGRVVSPWYRYTTEDVMDILAKESGFKFTMEFYDEETGAAAYKFEK